MTLPRASFEERFWRKVEKRGNDECWLWKAAMDRHGYGAVGMGRKVVGAHRASWMLSTGVMPDGLSVLHKCDNPACVNPAHLFVGNAADNMRDMRNKGRAKPPPIVRFLGSDNPSSKLNDEQVAEIRRLAGVETQIVLAKRFGIGCAQVSRIQTGKRRGHAAA